MKPLLPTNISDVEKILNDPNWAITEKMNGQRCVASVGNYQIVTAIGRNGSDRDLPSSVERQLTALPLNWTFDGEIIGDHYYVFDILETPDYDLRDQPWLLRAKFLNELFCRNFFHSMSNVGYQLEDKTTVFNLIREGGSEGVVFKDIRSKYQEGRRDTWLKFKFMCDIDCVVTGKNQGKANLILSVHKDGRFVEVGKVSALTGDGPNINIGDIVEVSCLYVTPTHRLYHAKMPRIRTDKTSVECSWDQIIDNIKKH